MGPGEMEGESKARQGREIKEKEDEKKGRKGQVGEQGQGQDTSKQDAETSLHPPPPSGSMERITVTTSG